MIREAAADRTISGLVLIIDQPEINLAQVEEFTRALNAFKAKGKPIYCYMDEAGNATYALAAAATHVTLAENSELGIVGLHGEMMFFKGLLDKLGIEAEMLHMGAYKSALEPFTRTEPSPEAAENVNWLLDGIYARWLQLMADGRKLSTDEVKKIVDQAPITSEDALKLKLVDEVSSFGAFRRLLKKEFGKDVKIVKNLSEGGEGGELKSDDIWGLIAHLKTLFEEAASQAKGKEEPAVGLIYIQGMITMGDSDEDPFGGGGSAGSTTIRHALETAREDDSIKAVVVRVDSPGGSALASDIIWNAGTRCAAEKPVIVSMGRVAGSGGYYVALPGDPIFAEASTLTGSIGVVGGKLVLKDLFQNKLGITTTEFTRGQHAGLMSMSRKWTESERSWIEKYMHEVYDQFKGRVQKSRGQKLKKELEDLAGGRVYTGQQALDLGLVDKIGGLDEALNLAAEKAGLGKDYEVRVLPKPSGLAALIHTLKKMSGDDDRDEYEIGLGQLGSDVAGQLRSGVAGQLSSGVAGQLGTPGAFVSDPLLRAALPLLHELAPAQLREFLRGVHNLITLQHEHVGCFMPFVPDVK